MNERLQVRSMRRGFSHLGWVLLIYYGILNLMVSMVDTLQSLYQAFQAGSVGGLSALLDTLMDAMVENLTANGWGYILAGILGVGILAFWKGRQFFQEAIFAHGRPITLGALVTFLCLTALCQAAYQLLYLYQEWWLNRFGLSLSSMLESASSGTTTLSMFLYTALFAPVVEELMFRGLVLRSLKPYGKQFAIVLSAFLFGMYHGNLVQAPFAFLMGLLLGYVADEYSILWAMVLHMFNNLVLGDSLPRLLSGLGEGTSNLIQTLLIFAGAAAAIVLLVKNRKKVKTDLMSEHMDGLAVKSFFTAPGVLALCILLWLEMLIALAALAA